MRASFDPTLREQAHCAGFATSGSPGCKPVSNLELGFDTSLNHPFDGKYAPEFP